MVLIVVKCRYFQIVFHVEVNITCVVFFTRSVSTGQLISRWYVAMIMCLTNEVP